MMSKDGPQMIPSENTDIASDLARVDHLEESGKYIDALDICMRILQLYPQNVHALSRISLIFVRLERYGEAADVIRNIIILDESNPSQWANLAFVLAAIGRSDDALVAIKQANKLGGDDGFHLLNFAKLCCYMDNLSLASRACSIIHFPEPDKMLLVYMLIISIFISNCDYLSANAKIEDMLRSVGGEKAACVGASLYMLAGNYEKSRLIFETVDDAGPNAHERIIGLSSLMMMVGDLDAAKMMLLGSLGHYENNFQDCYLLACIAHQEENFEDLEVWVSQLIEVDPHDATINYFAGALCMRRGRYDAAEQFFLKSISMHPYSQSFLFSLYDLYKHNIGRHDDARQCLKHVISLGADTKLGKAASRLLER